MLFEQFEYVRAVNLLKRLLAGSDAIFQVRPPVSVPLSASHDGKGPQAGSGVTAKNLRQWRLRKLSVSLFRKHSHAGGCADEAVERNGVSSDLICQLFRGFGSRLDEVRDTKLGQTRDSARDIVATHELEYAGVCRRSLGLWHHLLFTWISALGFAVAQVYLLTRYSRSALKQYFAK